MMNLALFCLRVTCKGPILKLKAMAYLNNKTSKSIAEENLFANC